MFYTNPPAHTHTDTNTYIHTHTHTHTHTSYTQSLVDNQSGAKDMRSKCERRARSKEEAGLLIEARFLGP